MADDTVTVEAPVRPGPALSATSDAPVVTAVVPPAVTEVDTITPKVEAKTEAVVDAKTGEDGEAETGADDAGNEDADASTTADEAGKKPEIPAYAKREITKTRNQKRAAEEARDAALQAKAESDQRLSDALKALAERGSDAKPKVTAETPRPKRDQFDDPEAYDEALVSWTAKQTAAEVRAEIEAEADRKAKADAKTAQDAERTKTQTERAEAWASKREAFMKDHPDFEDVAESEDVKISPVMTALILEADNGPELAYALGKNPEQSARIAQLTSPAKVALEMGKFAASIEAAKKPKVSKAPPPAKPLGSRADAGKKSPDEMSMDEYAAMRTPQIIAERMGPGARHRAN